jgi:hypothetical protein
MSNFGRIPPPSNAYLSRSNSAASGYAAGGQQYPAGLNIDRKQMDIEAESVLSYEKPHHDSHHHPEPTSLTIRERLEHFTFAWYASTMSTGGVAFVLSVIPNRFDGLTGLGTVMFVFNLFLFTAITTTMCIRFYLHPHTLKLAFTNPHEGFFVATFWLSLATMMTNTTAYGVPKSGPWIVTALRVAFWIYTVCSTLHAIIYYHVLFVVKKLVRSSI